jgi:hypothetical protein
MDDLRESNGAVERLWAQLARIEGQMARVMGEAWAVVARAKLDNAPEVDTDLKLARLRRVVRAINTVRQQALTIVDQLVVALAGRSRAPRVCGAVAPADPTPATG